MAEFARNSTYNEVINGEHIYFEGAEHLRYLDVHNLYAYSEYGVFHAQQAPRFSKAYPYEHDAMLVDLGDDVHPLRHMTHTESEICQPLITAQNTEAGNQQKFTVKQIAAMRLGTLLHDIGECEHPAILETVGHVVGDVPYLERTQSDNDLEVPIRLFFYDTLLSDAPRQVIEKAEAVISGTDNEFMQLAFNTMERIGYFQTAMKAGETALGIQGDNPDDASARFVQLARLARRVSNNHIGELEQRAKDFPHTRQILQNFDWLYGRIHTELADVPMEIN
jgi:hypothetical protein